MSDSNQSGVKWASVTVGDDAPMKVTDAAGASWRLDMGKPSCSLRVFFYSEAPLRRLYEALAEHFAAEEIPDDDPRLSVAVERAIDEARGAPLISPAMEREAQSNGEADEYARAAGGIVNHHEMPEQIAAGEASA